MRQSNVHSTRSLAPPQRFEQQNAARQTGGVTDDASIGERATGCKLIGMAS